MPLADIQSVNAPSGTYRPAHTARVGGSGSALANVFHRRRYRLLQFALDLLALSAAWYATLALRLAMNPLMPAQFTPAELSSLAPPLYAMLALWTLVALYQGIYRSGSFSTVTAVLRGVAESAMIAAALTIVVTFFSREVGANLSRSFVLLFAPISFVMMTGSRYAALLATVPLERQWPSPERVAVMGAGAAASQMVHHLRETGGTAIAVAGVILPAGASSEGLGNPVPVLGQVDELGALINRHALDRLIIVDRQFSQPEMDECARISKRMRVTASRALTPLDDDVRLRLTERYGLQLLELKPVAFTRGQQIGKRAFDLAASALLLLVLSPLLVLLAAAIKLTSKGPVFYIAPRVGKGGRHFTFLKFRSMADGHNGRRLVAAQNQLGGHVFKVRNDPRVTPIGGFMRRYSLDELPQLINVLRGQMSLVGPRPLPAEDLDPDGQSRRFAVWAEQRSRVLPGITGLWQVSGRGELSFEKWIEHDLYYVQNWSLRLDLRILLETPLVVLTARGAY